jgi:hypothetical protein
VGICIAYRGKLRDRALVPELVRDLTAKAKSVGWLYKTMDELVAEGHVTCSGLEGITLFPHRECDPLHYHFDGEGTFTNHTYHALLTDKKKAAMMLEALAESAAFMQKATTGPKAKASARRERKGAGLHASLPDLSSAGTLDFFKEGSRYNWVKTQHAGSKVHIAVCAVMRHIKQRYAPDLEIKDDSGYFADGDEQKLEAQLAQVDRILSVASQAIATAAASAKGPMSLDTFVDRINEELADAGNKLH